MIDASRDRPAPLVDRPAVDSDGSRRTGTVKTEKKPRPVAGVLLF